MSVRMRLNGRGAAAIAVRAGLALAVLALPSGAGAGIAVSQMVIDVRPGDSSVELTEGKQCDGDGKACRPLPGKRLYAGASWAQPLGGSGPVEYRLRTADGWTSMKF